MDSAVSLSELVHKMVLNFTNELNASIFSDGVVKEWMMSLHMIMHASEVEEIKRPTYII